MDDYEDLIITTQIDIDYNDAQKKIDKLVEMLDKATQDRTVTIKVDTQSSGNSGNGSVENSGGSSGGTGNPGGSNPGGTGGGDSGDTGGGGSDNGQGSGGGSGNPGGSPGNGSGGSTAPAVRPTIRRLTPRATRTPQGNQDTREGIALVDVFQKGIMSLIKRFVGLAAIMKGFNMFISYLKQVLTWNMAFRKEMAQLKGAVLTLIQPIIEFVVPYVTKLVSLLAKVVTMVAKVVSAAFGKTLKQSADSARELYYQMKNVNKTIADYDELSVINRDMTIYPDFNLDEDSSLLDGLMKKLEPIISKVKELATLFSTGFKLNFDISVFDRIKGHILGIGTSLQGIFSDGKVAESFEELIKKISENLGVVTGSLATIITSALSSITGTIDLWLSEDGESLKEHLINIFDISGETSDLIGEVASTVSGLFSGIVESDAFQQINANLLGTGVDSALSSLELAMEVINDVIDTAITPLSDNLDGLLAVINSILEPTATVTGALKQGFSDAFDKISEVYDEKISPMFDSLKEGMSDTVSKFTESWEEYVAPTLTEIGTSIEELISEKITPAFNEVMDFIGNIAEAFTIFYENYIKPVVDLIIELWTEKIRPQISEIVVKVNEMTGRVAETLGNLFEKINRLWNVTLKPLFTWIGKIFTWVVNSVLKPFLTFWIDWFWAKIKAGIDAIGGLFDGLLDIFDGVIDFITGTFTGDWKGALQGLVDIGAGIVNLLIRTINLLIDGLNTIVTPIRAIVVAIMKATGSETSMEEIAIPHIPEITIPQLAQGTVVPPNREFAAILGDNKTETEVVSPLSTIKEALIEALETAGGTKENIVLQLNGKTIAQAVWEQDKKRYKQFGSYSPA